MKRRTNVAHSALGYKDETVILEVGHVSRIKVAVVGTGAIAEAAHIPGFLSCSSAELVAVVDSDAANLTTTQKLIEQHTGLQIAGYPSLTALIASGVADAVSLAVPNAFHVPLALEAVAAGLDVLVEKPLALTTKAAVQLKDAASKAGVVVMVGQTHRYRDDVAALKRFVDDGALGKVYHAEARILRRRGTPTGWFTELATAGGGPLLDIGVHALDLAWWLMGKPVPTMVLGNLRRAIGNDQVDFVDRWTAHMPGNQDNAVYDTEDFATALLRFDSDATLSLTASWNVNGMEDDRIIVNLYGTKAGISLEPPAIYGVSHGVLTTTTLPVSSGNPHQKEMHHFIECVRTRQEPLSPVSDAVTVTAMLAAIQRSSEQKTAVSVGWGEESAPRRQ